jgi:hypothetical protein
MQYSYDIYANRQSSLFIFDVYSKLHKKPASKVPSFCGEEISAPYFSNNDKLPTFLFRKRVKIVASEVAASQNLWPNGTCALRETKRERSITLHNFTFYYT